MKNHLQQTLLLTVFVIVFLTSFSLLNSFLNNPFGLKKIDLLADIRAEKQPLAVEAIPEDTATIILNDTIVVTTKELNEVKQLGPVYLEDYSSGKENLDSFVKALGNTKRQPVRIAFFGDSFIEGDILCGSLRDTLQGIFGGHGVGFVPMASEVAQFRMSIKHTYDDWQTFSIVGKKSEAAPLGLSGYSFVPGENNLVSFHVPRKTSNGFDQFRLFYTNQSDKKLAYTVNDTLQHEVALTISDSLQELSLDIAGVRSIDLRFIPADSIVVYGGSFETSHGIFVDNFAMRSNPGHGLALLQDKQLKRFNDLQDYKLILLQYGLNVVSEKDSLGYAWYINRMVSVIQKFKTVLPNASIVLIGVSDRSSNQDGTFATLPAIPIMRDAQRKIAQRSGVAFWDLYSAMGGSGTMVRYVSAVPPLAAKDYTHLTYPGGKKIAKKLADALLHEYKKNGKANNH